MNGRTHISIILKQRISCFFTSEVIIDELVIVLLYGGFLSKGRSVNLFIPCDTLKETLLLYRFRSTTVV